MLLSPKPELESAAVYFAISMVLVLMAGVYQRHFRGYGRLYNPFQRPAPLASKDVDYLASFLVPFKDFDAKQRSRFLSRFEWLCSRMKLTFYGAIDERHKIIMYVMASATLLTMGMKRFRYLGSVHRVIIYPSKYYSKINRRHHLGEYNPRLKILVFAADTLKEGFRIPNDNINLGIHEFSHALCYEMKKGSSWEARRFRYGLRKLDEFLNDQTRIDELIADEFFRGYGVRNTYEFFAVLSETFIESPNDFYNKHPYLFEVVKAMYNFNPLVPNWSERGVAK
ncbi:zinc-dependent peptidase [uncultured Croceitalea sp.]|uniref:zinc-dependent peptidase n=1 Tax=uncultured Croceitalea sp. TaxID=1798908 RepID=UPI0033060A6F